MEAINKAALQKRWGIDTNMQSTLDLVAIAKHWNEPGHSGDGYTHMWSGAQWGEGVVVPDPTPNLHVDQRPWSQVSRLTSADGTRRISSIAEHYAVGVKLGVRIVVEAKGSSLLDNPEFWRRLGAEADATGHPRMMMTLSDIGHPVRRLKAAKANNFYTAVLPRGTRPTGFDTNWATYTDAVWGSWSA